jgi:alpha-tubulin suppressor-like RCC1 family protein
VEHDTTPVDFDVPVLRVVAGDEHVCALLEDGTVLCWGEGYFAALGRGDSNTIGDNEWAADRPLLPFEDVVDIAAGQDHTCVVLESGDIICWGLYAQDSTRIGILGWPSSCEELSDASSGQCAYGDTGAEPLGDIPRLRFDWP